MNRIIPLMLALGISACGSDTDDSHSGQDSGYLSDMSDLGADLDMGRSDTGYSDQGTDSGTESDLGSDQGAPVDMNSDLGGSDMANTDMNSPDMADDSGTTDLGTDSGADMETDSGTDMETGGYDTTGWTMKRWIKNESASTGTPDSFFFDVDSGSPLSASIVGGGSGSWSVNVYGGTTNQLHCTGNSSCQIMLNPLDTVVIITAITTDIGSYTLTVDYAGMGPR